MLRFGLCVAALLGILAGASGCSICQAPDDCAYSAYGGLYPRSDMYNGRVGSAFAPAEGEMVSWSTGEATIAEPEAAPAEEPVPDAIEEDLDVPEGLETAY